MIDISLKISCNFGGLQIMCGFDKSDRKEGGYSLQITLVVLYGSLQTKWEFFSIFRHDKSQDTYKIKETSLHNKDFGASFLVLEDSRRF